MRKKIKLFAGFACCAQVLSFASAAPLDAFLSANQSPIPWKGQVEASYDLANDTVDIFKLREKNATTGRLSDYRGAHIHGGIAITPLLWVDGAIWQRQIDARSSQAKVSTWQVAAQYKLIAGAGYVPGIALRLGAWGNLSDELRREKNVQVAGVLLESASLSDPRDQQYQLDIIGTWPVSKRTELTAFASAGTSRVSFGSASATTTRDGCLYNLSFGPTHVVGTCETAAMSARFSTPNKVYGIDVDKEAKYSAKYYQAGLAAKWHAENWRLRAGYQYQALDRDQIDDIVESRSGVAYRRNHILVADIAYKIFKNTSVFLRGQYMSNQFSGEIPMAYNSLTANSFNQRFGILSSGLIIAF